MKRSLKTLALAVAVLSLNCCGLPGAIARTGVNAVKDVASLIPSASASGSSGS
jgi:hypothetical protein